MREMFKLKRLPPLHLKRLLSTSLNVLEHLKHRTLIRVSGSEVLNFLQGLITNDIEHLSVGTSNMFTMFLNSKGRILYDAIIYKNSEKDTYLIECDSECSDNLQKHLKMYRVRRKIDITDLTNDSKIYVLFGQEKQSLPKTHGDLVIYRDPRIAKLGSRIIARSNVNVAKQLGEIIKLESSQEITKDYRWLRYSLGVGEGIHDIPPGESFPLECNCDYLHGVSFHKGCYVGQELTARVHHTGLVRKRLMPLHFTKQPSKTPDEKIVHENVNLGKFRGMVGDAGLALLRIEKALAFKEIIIGDGLAYSCKPDWWPREVSKDKMNA